MSSGHDRRPGLAKCSPVLVMLRHGLNEAHERMVFLEDENDHLRAVLDAKNGEIALLLEKLGGRS